MNFSCFMKILEILQIAYKTLKRIACPLILSYSLATTSINCVPVSTTARQEESRVVRQSFVTQRLDNRRIENEAAKRFHRNRMAYIMEQSEKRGQEMFEQYAETRQFNKTRIGPESEEGQEKGKSEKSYAPKPSQKPREKPEVKPYIGPEIEESQGVRAPSEKPSKLETKIEVEKIKKEKSEKEKKKAEIKEEKINLKKIDSEHSYAKSEDGRYDFFVYEKIPSVYDSTPITKSATLYVFDKQWNVGYIDANMNGTVDTILGGEKLDKKRREYAWTPVYTRAADSTDNEGRKWINYGDKELADFYKRLKK